MFVVAVPKLASSVVKLVACAPALLNKLLIEFILSPMFAFIAGIVVAITTPKLASMVLRLVACAPALAVSVLRLTA